MRNWLTHRINPLHLFCRMRDLGIPLKAARNISKSLESFLLTRTQDGYGKTIVSYIR